MVIGRGREMEEEGLIGGNWVIRKLINLIESQRLFCMVKVNLAGHGCIDVVFGNLKAVTYL